MGGAAEAGWGCGGGGRGVQTLRRLPWGWGPVEEAAGEEVPSLLAAFGGTLTGPPPPPQDVDSRDRRRRELGPPESQEPREQPEPSTSWWPVSSAEKKKNITLVRTGQTRYSQNGGRGEVV